MHAPNHGLATAAILDLLTDGFDELLWLLEGVVRQWGIPDSREVAREVLLELAAAERVEFWRVCEEAGARVAIPPDDGVVALRSESAWELGFPATTVSATEAGYQYKYTLPVLPEIPQPDFAPYRNEAIRRLQGTDQRADARDGDLVLATAVILDDLADGFDLPEFFELDVRKWGDEQPRETARRALIALAEAGHVEFLTCTVESPRGDPIPLEDGLAAIRGETAWDVFPSTTTVAVPLTTVALTASGHEHHDMLPDLRTPWRWAAEPLLDDIGTAQAD